MFDNQLEFLTNIAMFHPWEQNRGRQLATFKEMYAFFYPPPFFLCAFTRRTYSGVDYVYYVVRRLVLVACVYYVRTTYTSRIAYNTFFWIFFSAMLDRVCKPWSHTQHSRGFVSTAKQNLNIYYRN